VIKIILRTKTEIIAKQLK